MCKKKNLEIRIIFILVAVLFLFFLAVPTILLLIRSVQGGGGITISHYREIFSGKDFGKILGNSFGISALSALITTAAAFFLAYTIHYTNLHRRLKGIIRAAAVLPMLLPTITYGFAIIYSFGKQGLITRLLGHQLFDIYGFNGLLIGYVIYTLPVSFLLIQNTMGYIDKRFSVVSRVMGDSGPRTFLNTVMRPLLGTLTASFIQCFFLCFTDFGIPASVGGKVEVLAGVLYTEMLGSVPNFGNGAVVSLVMLLPSILSIAVLHWLERYNIRYNKLSLVELKRNTLRDFFCGTVSLLVLLCTLSIFVVIFVIPFVTEWPYSTAFTLDHIKSVFRDSALSGVFQNSLMVAALTAVLGTLAAYGAALVSQRSTISSGAKKIVESIALVTNTIPGMVLGIAFMLAFSGTPLQNTFPLIILCNIVHYFSTPYLMMKNSLSKMNLSWETTAKLMGDSWLKTILRVVTPNAFSTMLEVFSYYFINAMVTVSAVIFLAGARTMVITTKIKELQHYAKFNQIFVLSLLILFTNIIAKLLFQFLANRKAKKS